MITVMYNTLQPIGVSGFRLWFLQTPHHLADVLRPGYFAAEAGMMQQGDRIMCNLNTEGQPQFCDLWVTGPGAEVTLAGPVVTGRGHQRR